MGSVSQVAGVAFPNSMAVIAETNSVTGDVIDTIWTGTQAEYDAIAVKDDSTLYVIV